MIYVNYNPFFLLNYPFENILSNFLSRNFHHYKGFRQSYQMIDPFTNIPSICNQRSLVYKMFLKTLQFKWEKIGSWNNFWCENLWILISKLPNYFNCINLTFKVIGTSGDNKEYLWTMERNLDMDTQYQAKLKQDYNN